jgi:type VI secretion system protein ImpJ
MQDRFLEDTLQFRIESLSYCPWGFRELRVDREALAGGQFRLSRAAGLLPDGLPFDIPDSDSAPPPRPLVDHFGPGANSVDVYLAVPQHRDHGINVSAPGSAADTRYIAEVAVVHDEARGGNEKPVQVASKGFRFLFEEENRQGYSFLRVARVRKGPSGDYEIDTEFVPPLLDIRVSDLLLAIARRLVETLGARSGELASMRRHKNQSLADFTTADIASFWLLYTINVHFPVLRHLFEVKGGHPEELFSVMLDLAGSLTTFSIDLHPRDLPVYDHDALGTCFRELDDKLRLLLDTVVPKNYVSLPLRQVQPSIYAASLANEEYFRNTRFYLAIRADMDHGELISRAPAMVKVSSANQVETLVRHAVSGLTLTHVVRPPSRLPVKLHFEYFSLTQSGPYWDAMVRSRNLAAYVPDDFPSPELELIVLLPEPR